MPPPSTLRPGAIVWDYLRDSGGSAQELSVLQQAEQIELFCQRYGLVLARSNRDVARSGTSTVGRDAFMNMIDDLRDSASRPQAILLWSFSRFARDLTDATYYKATIRRSGIIIHSLTDSVPDSEHGVLIETLIDYSNQEKSQQTSRDVKRALRSRVAQGFSSGGTPPRCYLAERVQIGLMRDGTPRMAARWTPDPELWELGQLAWEMRAQGKSYSEIRKATENRLYKNDGCLNSFFANESYLGIGKSGAERIPGHHPALINQATWDAVQKLRTVHSKHTCADILNHPRNISAPSLLTGLLFCKQCGSAMSHQTYKASAWRCYICGRKSRGDWKSCTARMVNGRNAEIVVLDTFLNRILTPAYFTELLQKIQERFADNTQLLKQIKDINTSLSKVERAISNLLDILETQTAIPALMTRLQERQSEKATLTTKLRLLENQQAASVLEISPDALQIVFDDWRSRILHDLQMQDIQSVRTILQNFISRIEAGYDDVRIFCRYPLNPDMTINQKHSAWVTMDGESIEQHFSELSQDAVQSIFEIAPHLMPAPRKPRAKKPIKPRDLEIYRRHTDEQQTVPSLAKEYNLSEKSIWGICTRVRKQIQEQKSEETVVEPDI